MIRTICMISAALLTAFPIVSCGNVIGQDRSIYNRTESPLRMRFHPVGQPNQIKSSPRLLKNEKWSLQLAPGKYETTLEFDDGKTSTAGLMDFTDPRKNVSNLISRTTSTTFAEIDMSTGKVVNKVKTRSVFSFVYGADGVDQNGLRFGIRFRTCDEGIHVDEVIADMPSTRCIMPDGTTVSLEPDDHVLSVNGMQVNDVDEMMKAVASSPREMSFVVRDKNSGETISLKTMLAW